MTLADAGLWLLKALALLGFTRVVLYVERYRRVPAGSHVAELVELCRGNRGEAYRLVMLEKTRAPEISDKVAHERAIARLRRDRAR
jgi:hypothetical protein